MCSSVAGSAPKVSNDFALKFKSKQKFLNQTTISERSLKNQASTKIQAIPTLNLQSFKSRAVAPVTSRNMTNATSLATKKS